MPFIEYHEVPDAPTQTKQYDVTSRASSVFLGTVKFRGAWRCFVFEPAEQVKTVFDAECLRSIADFCETKTKEWRTSIQERRKKK